MEEIVHWICVVAVDRCMAKLNLILPHSLVHADLHSWSDGQEFDIIHFLFYFAYTPYAAVQYTIVQCTILSICTKLKLI